MSKTLDKLVERANKKGEAILNGRTWTGYGYSDLREKYAITDNGTIVTLRHWGTETLVINKEAGTIVSWYGESRSDADSMNYILSTFRINGGFRYFPSQDRFFLEIDGKAFDMK